MLALALLLACGDAPVSVTGPLVVLDERSPPEFGLKRITGEQAAELTFAVPSGGFLYELDIHATSGETAIAYTPPAATDDAGYDRSGIFLASADGAQRVACDDASAVWCFYPQWSSDGESIWFVSHDQRSDTSAPWLSRVELASGHIDAVQPWATEPAVSPTGEHIAWIAVDEHTGQRSLELGDATGTWLQTLIPQGQVFDLGQPMFSADGTEVLVVVLSDSLSWRQLLNPFPVAYAHDNHSTPGDWWSIAISGGELQQVTHTGRIHYDGAIDPISGDLLSVTDLGLVKVAAHDGTEDWLYWARTLRAVDVMPTE